MCQFSLKIKKTLKKLDSNILKGNCEKNLGLSSPRETLGSIKFWAGVYFTSTSAFTSRKRIKFLAVHYIRYIGARESEVS